MPVVIKVNKNGSLGMDADQVSLIDHNGSPIPFSTEKPRLALCRCGASARKPFCDGSHKTNGFTDPVEG
jgi:CDGSH-type Zn-finger protein